VTSKGRLISARIFDLITCLSDATLNLIVQHMLFLFEEFASCLNELTKECLKACRATWHLNGQHLSPTWLICSRKNWPARKLPFDALYNCNRNCFSCPALLVCELEHVELYVGWTWIICVVAFTENQVGFEVR
jgi:hypothetical protein